MKIQEKPDYLIFADSAKNGECVKFPDVSRGWGVTIDQTASKPPLEWMNGAFNRIDKNMMYLLQQGVPEWCEYVKYPVNAIIKYNGVLYTAIVENDNAIPTTSDKWKKTIAEIPNASTNQIGVIKLNSATNSTSETEAATPFAVKKTYDLASSIIDTFKPLEFESVIFSPDKMYHAVVRNDGVIGFYNSKINKLVWSVSSDGGLNDGYVNADRIRGLQYNSDLNSDASNQIATPLAIKNTNNRITDVHNIVININDKFNTNDIESRVYSHDKRFNLIVRDDGTVGMYNSVTNSLSWGFTADGVLGVGKIGTGNIFDLEQFVYDRIPVGVPLPWPTNKPPAGWFECNGSTFDKSKFPKLANAYPSGYLPDLRGVFIRGLDTGSGLDPNRGILSYQGDAIRNITGTFGFESALGGNTGSPTVSGAFYETPDAVRKHISASTSGTNSTVVFDASRVVPTANENRPRNVAFMYIVKAV